MGMNVGGGGSETDPMLDINMTPLIDVMLVLLIMFIVTIPIMTHAVKLDMPRPNPNVVEPPVPPEVIELEIDYDGTILWNQAVVPGLGTLEQYFSQEAAKSPQPELHIRANKRVKYDTVAKVLALAQREGITKIGFVGMEQFAE
ncbi:MAG: biopolymer transporter ExbD [Gammaproteobacteria bacterium]|nr:biopolymer transporter ExbD [Gammaproteobacteria bacterium]